MDTKIAFTVLTVMATLLMILAKTNVKGEGSVILNKPFFSSNLLKSESFKHIKVIEATEKATSVTNSKAASKTTTTNVTKTFTCTSQKGDNTTKSKPTPITLHETPITTPPKASTSYSVDNPRVVSTGVYSTSSPDGKERQTISGSECPSGYTKQLHNSCYKFVDSGSGATRSEARPECKRDSSHLVFIETTEENDFLVEEAESNKEYWIGIHERPNLFWDDGSQVNFANIDPYHGHTFDSNTDCYRMSDNEERYWFDKSCSEQYGYICENEGADCPSGYTKQLDNSCYTFVDSDLGATRSEARSECKRNTSHLVFIETKEENDFLVEEAESNSQYWIGIHERPNLFWDNGNQVTFANIDPDNEPGTFNGNTGCYRMSKNDERYWADERCSRQYGYICEYEGAYCPSEYIKLNGSCYKFVDSGSGANRSEARSECKRNSSHLVFIETKEENDFMLGKVESNSQYWIGIHERPNLFWDDGSQVTFANIDPDNSLTFNDDTGCYRMSNNDERYWAAGGCSTQYGYICEYEGADCPSGYTKKLNNSCYKFVDSGSEATRSAARSECKRNSSHLVFIETKEENDFLVGEVESNSQYWIGIHERPNLFWDNGNQVTFANIDPDNGATFDDDTGCYRMSDNDERGWLDRSCSTRYGYICEYEG